MNSPNKVLAVRAERRLLEESGNEAMVLDVVDVLLFECTFSIAVPDIELILLLVGHIIVVSHGNSCVPVITTDFARHNFFYQLRPLGYAATFRLIGCPLFRVSLCSK